MKSKNIAKIIVDNYPSEVFVDYPLEVFLKNKVKDMKTLTQTVKEGNSGDGLFDFIVTEIGKERSKKEIIWFLERAILDVQAVLDGFLKFKE